MTNSVLPASGSYFIDHVRSYVMGIFLDVPKDILDLSFAKWRKDVQLLLEQALQQQQVPPDFPACGASFWKDPALPSLDTSEVGALVGVYVSPDSPEYCGSITVSKTPENQLMLRVDTLSGTLDLGSGIGRVFLWGRGPRAMLVEVSKNVGGKHVVSLAGALFTQQ
ncbi:hypothetical protein Gpo141_00005437 [Globisporangium polare]